MGSQFIGKWREDIMNGEDKAFVSIDKIEVGGFRNIHLISLELNKINGLVALNGYGKSNLLDGIDFGFKFMKNSPKERIDMMGWSRGIPLNTDNALDDFSFNVELSVKMKNEETYKVEYGYKFRWAKDDKSGRKIVWEQLRLKDLSKQRPQFQYVIKRKNNETLYKASSEGRCIKPANPGRSELLINRLALDEEWYLSEVVKVILDLHVVLERNLDPNGLYEFMPIVFNDQIDNIPELIYNLKIHDPDIFNTLIYAFKQLFPEIEEVIVDEEISNKYVELFKDLDEVPFKVCNKIYMIYIKQKNINQPLDIKFMSSGTKKMLMMLLHIVLAQLNGTALIAVEEPENSIHPKLLQSFLRIIDQLSSGCKIIFTSHSPYLISYIPLADLFVGAVQDNGLADFRKIKPLACKRLIKEAELSGVSTGELIFDLLCGDDDDNEFLKGFLNNNG